MISETKGHRFRQVRANIQKIVDITKSTSSWLVYCLAHPLAKGPLWDKIKEIDGLLDRTLVVISAASLRSAKYYVREQAAQETIALDLARSFSSSEFESLMKCKHVVVRFDYDSVFHWEKGKDDFDNYLRPFDGGPRTNPDSYGT
ncbi:MAG: hypothetical protein WCC90_20835, partial [Methylocella sp.]